MVKKGHPARAVSEQLRTPDFSEVPQAAPPVLSAAQQQVYDGLAALMDEDAPRAALLFGVTGSGKTQVYLKLIEKALAKGKSAIVLVPEIGLTPQVLRQFAALFGDEVAVMHSALSVGERYDSFKKIRSGRARVVIGTRSAVFAPVQDLGVLIIDEEQDGRVPLRAVAALPCARRGQVPRCAGKRAARAGLRDPLGRDLLRRAAGQIPRVPADRALSRRGAADVLIADMRGLAREGRAGVIGPQLESALLDTLEKGKQAILFLTGAAIAA